MTFFFSGGSWACGFAGDGKVVTSTFAVIPEASALSTCLSLQNAASDGLRFVMSNSFAVGCLTCG